MQYFLPYKVMLISEYTSFNRTQHKVPVFNQEQNTAPNSSYQASQKLPQKLKIGVI